jgi:RHH-type proline utilization regulon transcriptional repressor/proline dehydrogenase/delta 1-pyrroline-5-carboxylate dehydrogenase
VAKKGKASSRKSVEAETHQIGRELFDRLSKRTPSLFDSRWWEDRILSWAMRDESVKVQMFRFVDALPMLRDHKSIARHLQEYFEDVREHLPWAVRMGIDISPTNAVLGRALALNARLNAHRMAQRFIAGATHAEILNSVSRLRKQGFGFSLYHSGDAVLSEYEADTYQHTNIELLENLSQQLELWPEDDLLDFHLANPIPRMQLSIRLSSLCSGFVPIDSYGTSEAVKERLRPVLQAAIQNDAHLQVDVERFCNQRLVTEIFQDVLMESEFREYPNFGIAVQAYLSDCSSTLDELLKWTRKRKTPISIRLVKGDYLNYESRTAGYQHWPLPVFEQKWQTDASFETQTAFLLKNHEWLRPTIASHSLRAIAHTVALARDMKISEQDFELQMRYGIGGEQAQLLSEMGLRVRIGTPFGEPVTALATLARGHLENVSNDGFLRTSFSADSNGQPENIDGLLSIEEQLMSPSETGNASSTTAEQIPAEFQNELLTDFSQPEHRDAMQQAIDEVRSELGGDYALVINGHAEDGRTTISSRNPSNTSEIVGTVAAASEDQAVGAVEAASRAWPAWSKTDTGYRAEYLELIAAEMRNRRFELAAWVVLESGMPWADADAEVAEAIDYCMYYATEMRNLNSETTTELPGEENSQFYRSRGVCVLISPWNSPLSILTGMMSAAIVSGNTVVMKPAEQASVVGAKLMAICQHAGIPNGVVNFLPGIGEDLGPVLIGCPDADIIVFTGTREVGIEINQAAAVTDERQQAMTKVIAEMGGKNSIIIDDDADLDDAVAGVVRSAFGFAGQHCSSCSRAIVVKGGYDKFVKRLLETTESLPIGSADEPGTLVGPVIDSDSVERIEHFLESVDEEEATLALTMDVDALKEQGNFVGPSVFTDVDPDCLLAKHELPGPILAVIKARDIDEAITIANNTNSALVGGIYSRSPANLKRAKLEFEVGNLFINGPIISPQVGRHPFGGYRMSGSGVKSGSHEYLMQFLIPVLVTENTSKRGINKNAT